MRDEHITRFARRNVSSRKIFGRRHNFSSRNYMCDENFLIARIVLRRTYTSPEQVLRDELYFVALSLSSRKYTCAEYFIVAQIFMRRTVVSSPHRWCNDGLPVAHFCATKGYTSSRKGFLHDLRATEYARRIFCRAEISATK